MGTTLPSPKRGRPPIFGPSLLWPNGWMHQNITWYGGRHQPGDCVRWGPSPSPKRGGATQFSAYVYCRLTAGRIKMPLGTEVGLGQNDIVLHGDTALPLNRAQPPIFCPCLLWSNGCMHQDTTGYGGRPQPRRHWRPSSPSNTVARAETYQYQVAS